MDANRSAALAPPPVPAASATPSSATVVPSSTGARPAITSAAPDALPPVALQGISPTYADPRLWRRPPVADVMPLRLPEKPQCSTTTGVEMVDAYCRSLRRSWAGDSALRTALYEAIRCAPWKPAALRGTDCPYVPDPTPARGRLAASHPAP